ncbi:MAG: UDP-glucose/GDP-mannose dehydrogenase family protein [Candidatus Omnitrophota bacterium]
MAKSTCVKQSKLQNICVVGAGHVGLVAAACFAELGHSVICADSDAKRINSLNKMKLPFYEPDLEALVKKNIKRGNLHFVASLDDAFSKSKIIFLAVGTPPQADGSADLTSIENVARTIAKNLNSYKLIVEKSTVPVQTGQKVKETIYRYRKTSVDFDVASNPEFLREGRAVYDFFYPDRIVIGVESERAEKLFRCIYSSIKSPVIVTDINTAELIKHASNSFLATKISFINAVARICDVAGADIKKVALAMGLDSRIGKEFLQAGVGYGGSCFPKDVEAFIYISKKLGYDFSLLKSVKSINDDQRRYFVDKIKEHLWMLKDKTICVCGLSFKPDTDDIREAPSVDIVNYLLEQGAKASLYDPKIGSEIKGLLSVKTKPSSKKSKRPYSFFNNPYEAAKKSDCLCFLTEWDEFLKLDFKRIKKMMNYPLIADGRNMFDRKFLTSLGFEYIGMGR